MPQRAPRWSRAILLTMVVAVAGLTIATRTRDAAGGTAPAISATTTTTIVVRASHVDALPGIEQHAATLGYKVRRGAASLPSLAVTAPPGVDAARAVGDFISLPGVLYAEPVYRMASADAPSDALYPQQDYLEKVHAPEAWDTETGKPGIIVAVLDTGIDVGHPDLAGRIWTNPGEIAGNGIDDDGNGCTDDVRGCAFISFADETCAVPPHGDIDDDYGHGTFVAGIIAANANAFGIVGVARGVTIMPVKVLDCGGGGNSLDVAIGILYAAEHGARIINISLGGDIDAAILREAARVAHDQYGALIVGASGNSGGDGVIFPARYDFALAVGAASSDGTTRAPFSTAGPEVDVMAIGQGIIGTVPEGSCERFRGCVGEGPYAEANGTSFSAPQVSGLAALILSRRPFLTPEGVAAAIKSAADPVPQSGPNWAGAGRINMETALTPAYRLGTPGTARN